MATKNTRNARLLIAATAAGPYVPVNKTHGLKVAMPTDFSEDTGHGQKFKSNIPGLADYKVTVAAWYDTVYTALEYAALYQVPYFFQYYMDYADTQNYHKGTCYFGFNEQNSDLGNTTDQTFDMVNTGADPVIVRAGAVL